MSGRQRGEQEAAGFAPYPALVPSDGLRRSIVCFPLYYRNTMVLLTHSLSNSSPVFQLTVAELHRKE